MDPRPAADIPDKHRTTARCGRSNAGTGRETLADGAPLGAVFQDNQRKREDNMLDTTTADTTQAFLDRFGAALAQEDIDAACEMFDTDCYWRCLLYTSDAADDMQCVALGCRRSLKKKINIIYSHVTTCQAKQRSNRTTETLSLTDTICQQS